jgi:hypothetical protein
MEGSAENTQQATMQTPQGLDAKHSDELFPVQRQYIGNKLGSAKGPLRRSKNLGVCQTTPPRFAGRNRQRVTMQMPQGVDAKHSDELFPDRR